MGIQDLHTFIQTNVPGASVLVDLLRISRKKPQQPPGRKYRLVLDAECCLDRLYGGFFSDWASGGQWNRMVQFLAILIQHMQAGGIELVVFFNGSFESGRMTQWAAAQQNTRRNVASVLRHLGGKGTPPPKVWWVPPVCLRTCLRMALRHLNVTVMCTMDDHRQEVIAYCRENNFNALMVEDPEYAAFDPPRYFSSEHLKLTYKGSLETKEYSLAKVSETLEIPTYRLALLAALLGNHIISEEELTEFHQRACSEHASGKITADILVRGVALFIKNLGSSADDVEAVVAQVFPGGKDSERASKLRSAIQYYLNGTKDGFLRYRTPHKGGRNYQKGGNKLGRGGKNDAKPSQETLKFASETAESEQASLAAYKEATANSTQLAPEIVVEPPLSLSDNSQEHTDLNDSTTNGSLVNGVSGLQLSTSSSSSNSSAASPSHSSNVWQPQSLKQEEVEPPRPTSLVSAEVLRTSSERHQKGLMSPHIYQILTQGEIKLPAVLEDEQHKDFPSAHHFYRPIRQMVYGILFNLHHITYMQSHSNKTTGDKDASPQQQQTTPMPSVDPDTIVVREWVWSKSNPYTKPDMVKPEKLGWGVPTVQRLWFGDIVTISNSSAHSSTIDDKRRRLRAFLSCMRSDTQLMLNPSHVPQPMLAFACVVRYMMSFPDRRILRKHELDALIAQAFSPELMNATYLQDLQLPRLNSRGVQLATLVMTGIENALLANDACGAPIPWLMCCPWLYFDGKLFQHKLLKAETCKNLVELCDHRIDEVIKVERMRQAILEGLNPQFARQPLMPIASATSLRGPSMSTMNLMQAGMLNLRTGGNTRGNINQHQQQQQRSQRTVLARGGQLEIAGVVVGQWGANYGSNMARSNSRPGASSSGGYQGNKSGYRSNYGGSPAGLPASMVSPIYGGGRGNINKTARLSTRGRSNNFMGNRRTRGGRRDKDHKSRGPTVQMPNGTTVLASQMLQNGNMKGNKSKTDTGPVIGQFTDAVESTNNESQRGSSSLNSSSAVATAAH